MDKKLLKLALDKAYRLGQKYWRQGDSDNTSEWKKLPATAKEYETLVYETLNSLDLPAVAEVDKSQKTPVKLNWSALVEWWECGSESLEELRDIVMEMQPVQPAAYDVSGLLSVNRDNYPSLPGFFSQLWDRNVVVARVYGDSREEVNMRVAALNITQSTPVASQSQRI